MLLLDISEGDSVEDGNGSRGNSLVLSVEYGFALVKIQENTNKGVK